MKESIKKYFRLGIIQWMSHPPAKYDVLDSVKRILCDDFFDAIEVTGMRDEETRRKVRDMLAQTHVKVCYGAQPQLLGPGLNPNHLQEAERRKAEDALIASIDEAQYLGAGGIAFLSGKWSPQTKEENYRQLLKTTRNICDHAAQKGMMVELEAFDFDIDKAALIGPAPYAAQFAADMRMSHHNFGLMVDLSHFPITYESSRFAVQVMRPYITHLHLGNAVAQKGLPGYGDLHPRFGFPGSANDIPQLVDYFNVLKQEGFFRPYDPLVLSMEVTPQGGEDGDLILADTKRVIQRAWCMVED